MQLFTPDQLPGIVQGRVCRQSRLISMISSVSLLTIFIGVPGYFLAIVRPALWISVPIYSFLSLIAFWLIKLAVHSLRPSNWLMRIAPDGLWINLRSYQNRDFAPAATVLFVPYRDIASVGQHTVKRTERNEGSITCWTERFLDVQLAEPAPAEVNAEIAEERRRRVTNRYFGGFVTSSGRSDHVPVWMPREDVLRLAWKTRTDFVSPSLKKILRLLQRSCRIDEPTSEGVADANKLTSEDVDRMILECVETGDIFGAVKLLQAERGMSLTQAKKFVDELTVQL